MISRAIIKFPCTLCRQSVNKKYFQTSSTLNTLWVKEAKEGYNKNRPKPSFKERMRVGLQELKGEIALWSQEVKEHFEDDPLLIFRPGEVDVVWDFSKPESMNKWVVTSDSDHSEGMSTCSLTLTKDHTVLFSGNLSSRVPKDGRIKRAGYCNIKTMPARKSFKRETHLNWVMYNMLVMRVRGDGRNYLLNIHTKGYFDLSWNDMYHYVLYTRGGPYWQYVRIPFSKFVFGSNGRIQDKQESIPLDKITSFGITSARYPGDFSLEIDYIGLEFDPHHKEEFAYEMYDAPKYIVQV